MIRFRRSIQELSEGRTPAKIVLRDNDFWQSFAEDINQLIERGANGSRGDSERQPTSATESEAESPTEDALVEC